MGTVVLSSLGFARKTFIPYEPKFGENFARSTVVNVDPDSKVVLLESGQKMKYDYLVLATGTGGPFPGKLTLGCNSEDAIKDYDDVRKKVLNTCSANCEFNFLYSTN